MANPRFQQLLIDSSVYLATLKEGDPQAKDSLHFFDQIAPLHFEILLPTLVVCEVCNVLCREKKEDQIPGLLHSFEALTWIEMDIDETKEAISVFGKFSLKTSDALIASTALRYHAALITWDETLYREAKKHCDTFKPHEFSKHVF